MKSIRLLLLALIVIGIVALLTQKIWLPQLMSKLISSPNNPPINTSEFITFPSGSENLVAGQTYTLKWSGNTDPVQIFLIDTSLKSEGASVSISDRIYGVPNTGSYKYLIPAKTIEGIYELQIGNQISNPFQISVPNEKPDSISISPAEYSCADGKSMKTKFSFQGAHVLLSDKRELTLTKISEDYESGIKFSNQENDIFLWIKDGSSFLEEGGKVTYQACRISQVIN